MEDVVAFAALAWEARAVLDALQGVEPVGPRAWRGYLGDGAAVRVLQIGIGLERAERAAGAAPPAGLYLSSGCAGGLVPGVHAGDIVIGDRVLLLDGSGRVVRDAPADAGALGAWAAARGLAAGVGTVASSPVALTSGDVKREAALHGAVAVDMECGAIATVARERGISCGVVKVVLDEAGDDVGDDGTDDGAFFGGGVVDPETGEIDVRRAVATIALRPHWWPRAVRLARQQRIAERRLRACLAVVCSAGLDAFGLAPGAATPSRAVVG
jgi:nucleoside phosphorylase